MANTTSSTMTAAPAAHAHVCMYQGSSATGAGTGLPAGLVTGLAVAVAGGVTDAAGAVTAAGADDVPAAAVDAEVVIVVEVLDAATDADPGSVEDAAASGGTFALALVPPVATAGSGAAAADGSVFGAAVTLAATAGGFPATPAALRAAASLACSSAISLSFSDSRCSFLLLMSVRSFNRVFRSLLCCCRLATFSLARRRSSRRAADDLSPLPAPSLPVPPPTFGGTRASRSSLPAGVAPGEADAVARVPASATTAGLPGVPARQSLFCWRTCAAAAAKVRACASAEVGTRSTAPLLSALMLSR